MVRNNIPKKIALVTGAAGGLGQAICFELAKNHCTVIMAVKSLKKENEFCQKFQSLDIWPFRLDVTSADDIHNIYQYIIKNHQTLDILINNAGVYLDNHENGIYPSILETESSLLAETMAVNLYGPLMLIQTFIPLMKLNNYGRIVNVSSGMGRFGDLDNRGSFYRLSKLSLNGLTRIIDKEVQNYNILTNAVCPGWVRTKMGGSQAVRTADEACKGIVWAALLSDDGPRGRFFRDGVELDWCTKKNV